MSTPNPQQLLARARSAIGGLAGTDLDTLTDESLLSFARQLRRLVSALEALEIRTVGAIDTRQATIAEGTPSTTGWLRNQTHVGDGPMRVRCAKALARMPEVAAAFADGELSREHVEVITRVAFEVSDDLLPAVQPLLVDHARRLAPAGFSKAAAGICEQMSPRRKERERRPSSPRRWLQARRTSGGDLRVSGSFDAASGEEVLALIDAATVSGRHDDARPLAVRRADALLELCRAAARTSPARPAASETINAQEVAGALATDLVRDARATRRPARRRGGTRLSGRRRRRRSRA